MLAAKVVEEQIRKTEELTESFRDLVRGVRAGAINFDAPSKSGTEPEKNTEVPQAQQQQFNQNTILFLQQMSTQLPIQHYQ